MVAKPLCPLYKNIIKPLDRARYPELRYFFFLQRLEFSCPELFLTSGLHLAPALWASMHIPPVNPVRTTS